MMNIKIFKYFYIHFITIIYFIMAWYVDMLEVYLMTLLMVLIHEMGHFIMARYFKFDINKILVLPFGAFLSLNDFGRHHIIEELIVLLGGLSTHLIIYVFLRIFHMDNYLYEINRLILMFNLLPIYPLDGSKILLLLLSLITDYYQALMIQIKLSVFFLSCLIILYFKVGYIVVYSFVVYNLYNYYKNIKYIYIDCLLDTSRKSVYHRIKMNKKMNFYRPYINYYLINNNIYHESDLVNILVKKR